MHKSLRIIAFLTIITAWVSTAYSSTSHYRAMFREDPSKTFVVGWEQDGGGTPTLYYDTIDHGQNWNLYANSAPVNRSVSQQGMDNRFVRLYQLQPQTKYYFVIRDNDGVSPRMYVQTMSDDPTVPISMIAGGDSRNNRSVRQNANKMAAKLRPDFIAFGGDYTDLNLPWQWDDWMDDWQLTIAADGRLIPLVATRGNHEWTNNDVYNLFDVPSQDVYYALTFGGGLLRTYTLNSEIAVTGNQATWLENDLAANQNAHWKMAQYHRPMRPHVGSKSEQEGMRQTWAESFFDHGVNLVVECDAHTCKTTWPIRPTYEIGHDEGFIRDDICGTVYVGEGCWGAPLRSDDDGKAWTRASGKFNQFKWIWINQDSIEIRTVRYDNVNSVPSLTDATKFNLPANIDIWSPSNGDVVVIPHPTKRPQIQISDPAQGALIRGANEITVHADANDPDGITQVEFYMNNSLVSTDNTFPYTSQIPTGVSGLIKLEAIATDGKGLKGKSDAIFIAKDFMSASMQVIQSSDDAEEDDLTGIMSLTSSDLDMVEDGILDKIVGVRFQSLPIPQGATVTAAYIQFTADENKSSSTALNLQCQATDNASTFTSGGSNISNRSLTFNQINWSVPIWSSGDRLSPQRTPNLKNLVQEVINRPGWTEGNSIVFVIRGSGDRDATSFDENPLQAAELILEFDYGPSGPKPNLGGDIIRCPEEVVQLDAGPNYISYQWQNDPTENSRYYSSADSGAVVLRVGSGFNGLNYLFDTINIARYSLNPLNTSGVLAICGGDSARLNASPGFQTYQWSTGSTAQSITTMDTGWISLSAIDVNGCTSYDSVYVTRSSAPDPGLPADTGICPGCMLVLSIPGNYQSIIWNGVTQSRNVVLTPFDTGWLYVEVIDQQGCRGLDSTFVYSTAVGIGNLNLEDLQLVPNPVSSAFSIIGLFEAFGPMEIDLFDLNGKWLGKLFEGQAINKLDLELDPNLPEGLYLMRLSNEEGAVTKRIRKI